MMVWRTSYHRSSTSIETNLRYGWGVQFMKSIERVLPSPKPTFVLASLFLIAGSCGMAISFLFLASSHPLDVTAGAAGFVAGAVMLAAGLISLVVLEQRSLVWTPPVEVANDGLELAPALVDRWLSYFRRNRQNRREPEWHVPVTLSAETVRPL